MFLKHTLPAFLWALFIFILTMMPGKYIPPVNIWDIANLDKLAHLFVFVVLLVLTLYGFLKQDAYKILLSYPMLIAFTLCTAYGFLLEVMQGMLLSDRYFEWYDAVANAAGCVAGIILFKFIPQKNYFKAERQ